MHQKENPASACALGGADCDAQQYCNHSSLDAAKIKAPAAGESRRLIASRYSPAVPDTALAAALLLALRRRAGEP
jgi:hypothetical protein